MPIPHTTYFKERRKDLIARGICPCNRERVVKGLKLGKACRLRIRKAKAARKSKAEERGKCNLCGKRKARAGFKSCFTCAKKWRKSRV